MRYIKIHPQFSAQDDTHLWRYNQVRLYLVVGEIRFARCSRARFHLELVAQIVEGGSCDMHSSGRSLCRAIKSGPKRTKRVVYISLILA